VSHDERVTRLLDEVDDEVEDGLGIHAEAERWKAHRYDPETAPSAVLQLDDVSGVPFLQDIVGVQYYQLRTRVRAGDGDAYVAACPGMDDYERYCRDHLGLGAPRFFQADPVGPPIEVASACRHGRVFEELTAWAREVGGIVVHPYMGIDAVWELAADLARAAGVPVQVLAPTPPATWYANDKAHVTALADRVVAPALDTPANVATRTVATPVEMVAALRELSTAHDKVALKMTRFASAMGNRVFDAAELRAMDDEALTAVVTKYLADKAWRPGMSVLVVRWIDMAPSPSTQLWIPPLGHGRPRLDGIYEQLLEGPERVFLGSIPSRFGEDVHRWLTDASLLMAGVYQRLGYVGRCSFDFILDGDQPLFVECNGRWGGTSTPMHLVDRLVPGGRPAYRARDYVSERWAGMTFSQLAAAVGDELYDPRTGRGRFVLYNVGCLAFGKFDVIAFGRDIDEATRALEEELPRLLA